MHSAHKSDLTVRAGAPVSLSVLATERQIRRIGPREPPAVLRFRENFPGRKSEARPRAAEWCDAVPQVRLSPPRQGSARTRQGNKNKENKKRSTRGRENPQETQPVRRGGSAVLRTAPEDGNNGNFRTAGSVHTPPPAGTGRRHTQILPVYALTRPRHVRNLALIREETAGGEMPQRD
ncbi:hypothetical protein SKAU_G00002310 [Synaphobranchus kaupii]|uniref:Uncharacterized protein n=1 Tax=Synaphobranchus kaupii TaxID=118154 RepID=A0A9Q1JBC7_SYNKA|nr:hypothetical protein SKAU_G00002310 [Synaphobranchus kaupii]